MKKKKYKLNWKNLFLILLLLIFFSGIIISSINIITWTIDNNKTQEEIDNINNILDEITESNENNNIKFEEEDLKKDNPYWKYINENINSISFNELKKINKDTAGWITVKGTNINYPFVQTKDNEYYLNHSFNYKKNKAGWLFLDYRNNNNEFDKNNIIYGHAVINGVMFGSLDTVLTNKWQNNSENHIITVYKNKKASIWQVFSVYTIPETTDYLKINFENEIEFENFINVLKNRSKYNFNIDVNKDDKILTLSSCYKNDNARIILHAKLIEEL